MTPKKNRFVNLRRYKRLSVDFLIKYETNSHTEPRITNVKNLSAGGVKFLTRELIPEASILKVNLLVPPLEKIFHANAIVLRLRRLKKRLIYSVAVSFTNISAQDKEVINQFVENLSEAGDAKLKIDQASFVVQSGKRNPV